MSTGKKGKLLFVLKILQDKTDETQGISVPEIIADLEAYGIQAERKSIYDDINLLTDFGFPVEKRKSKRFLYHYIQSDRTDRGSMPGQGSVDSAQGISFPPADRGASEPEEVLEASRGTAAEHSAKASNQGGGEGPMNDSRQWGEEEDSLQGLGVRAVKQDRDPGRSGLSEIQQLLVQDAVNHAGFLTDPQKETILEAVSPESRIAQGNSPILTFPSEKTIALQENIALAYEAILQGEWLSFSRTGWRLEKKKKLLKACTEVIEQRKIYPCKILYQRKGSPALIGFLEGEFQRLDLQLMGKLRRLPEDPPDIDRELLNQFIEDCGEEALREEVVLLCQRQFWEELEESLQADPILQVESDRTQVRATVSLPVNERLYRQLFSCGSRVKLAEPQYAVDEYREWIKQINKLYKS